MKTLFITAMASAIAFSAGAAEVNKTYTRKGDQEIRVFTVDGKLYCRRSSDNFEMCNGMTATGDAGTYAGAKMKHPDMPQFMTFDGTAVIGTNQKFSIKGCVLGGGVCDSEIWDEQ